MVFAPLCREFYEFTWFSCRRARRPCEFIWFLRHYVGNSMNSRGFCAVVLENHVNSYGFSCRRARGEHEPRTLRMRPRVPKPQVPLYDFPNFLMICLRFLIVFSPFSYDFPPFSYVCFFHFLIFFCFSFSFDCFLIFL